VETPGTDLELLATLSREMYDGAVAANAAYQQARELLERLQAQNDPATAALRQELATLAPEARRGGGRFRRRAAAPTGPPTLNGASAALMGAAMSMQEAEVAPTARQIAACDAAREQFNQVMERWQELRAQADDRR
jgi:hypothetical protein